MIEVKFEKTFAQPAELTGTFDRLFHSKDARFFELPARMDLWSESARRAKDIDENFTATVVVGIGGSSLGARALEHAFGSKSRHRVFFAESPDETFIEKLRQSLTDLKKIQFVFISKSGKTIETLALLDYWDHVLSRDGEELAQRSTVICGAGASPLRTWAEANHVPILPVPEDVGGRFSVLTPVGLLPSALMGISLDKLRDGAEWALAQKSLVTQLAAASLESFRSERWITQMWIYSDAYRVLGLWWQQLWSESLGKRVSRSGTSAPRASTPMVCMGPQDQHSLLQQVQEGFKDKWILGLRDPDAEGRSLDFNAKTLRGIEKSLDHVSLGQILAAEADGFLGAIKEAGIPSLVMNAPSSKPESWGAFFMLWELVIAVLGESMSINAFDQPGVELGKRLAIRSLQSRL